MKAFAAADKVSLVELYFSTGCLGTFILCTYCLMMEWLSEVQFSYLMGEFYDLENLRYLPLEWIVRCKYWIRRKAFKKQDKKS